MDYLITRSIRLGLTASWTENQSNEAVFDYQNTSLGAALRLQFRF